MMFQVARPDIVRAVHQRWLLNFWVQHLDGHPIPPWQTVRVDGLSGMTANLSLLDVVGGNGDLRFAIRYHGATVGQVYGSADCRGRYLDEVVPENAGFSALKPYRQAVACGLPVYTINEIADRNGRPVHYERLLLPFAHDGRSVDRILASFEFFCPDGACEFDALMSSQALPPTPRIAATIEPRAFA